MKWVVGLGLLFALAALLYRKHTRKRELEEMRKHMRSRVQPELRDRRRD